MARQQKYFSDESLKVYKLHDIIRGTSAYNKSRISKVVNYRTAGMSIDSLIRILHALGYRIPVQVEPLHKAA